MKKLYLFLFFSIAFLSSAFAQKALEKANKLYKVKDYTAAIEFYKKALEEDPRLSTKTKLAYCYYINNRMTEAEKLYAEITTQEKAKVKTYLYYGETLMSNGKYPAAKKAFQTYLQEEPDNEKVELLIASCDYVQKINPYFENVKVEDFPYNSEADDNTPTVWKDYLVFSSDRSSGLLGGTQKSGFTGRNFINIFYSEMNGQEYSEPKVFSTKLSVSNKNTGNPSFSKDNSTIFFTRNGVELSRKSIYNLAIYSAQNTGEMRWKNIKALPFCSKESNYMHPAISPDGKTLFFVSDKARGQGGTDIWISKLTSKGWTRTENLGDVVNTAANEGYPYCDEQGRLFFCSKGHPGYGGFDIFVTEKDDKGNWKKPINLGVPINSPRDDISIYWNEKTKKGMFTSNRNGGDDDIFLFETDIPFTDENEPVFTENTTPVEQKAIVFNENGSITKDKEAEFEEGIKKIKVSNEEVAEEANPIIETPKEDITKTESKEEITQQNTDVFPNTQQDNSPIKEMKTNESEAENAKTDLPDFYDLLEINQMTNDNKLEVGQLFRIPNSQYDFEIYQVTPHIAKEAQKVLEFLENNPTVKIEVGAHTESKGNDKNNLILSRYRAEAFSSFLVRNGIAKERIKSKGYGETQILNHCLNNVSCSVNDHLYNQRLELKITAL